MSVKDAVSAFKIGTDALLLGAYIDAADHIEALEVGSGCGIISLMVGRKCSNLKITGIDIDAASVMEANANAKWNNLEDRIVFLEQDFNSIRDRQFDLIFSNPPYFENSLHPEDLRKSNSRHTSALSFEELISGVASHLIPGGSFYCIIPSEYEQKITSLASDVLLNLRRALVIRSLRKNPAIRSILCFVKDGNKTNILKNELSLQNSLKRNDWSEDYKSLLQEFKSFD